MCNVIDQRQMTVEMTFCNVNLVKYSFIPICRWLQLCSEKAKLYTVRVNNVHHRLRGSASPVLTATYHSYGSPKLSDFFPAHPWRSEPQPILTQNGSNDVHSRKDDTFAVKIATFHTPDLQGP